MNNCYIAGVVFCVIGKKWIRPKAVIITMTLLFLLVRRMMRTMMVTCGMTTPPLTWSKVARSLDRWASVRPNKQSKELTAVSPYVGLTHKEPLFRSYWCLRVEMLRYPSTDDAFAFVDYFIRIMRTTSYTVIALLFDVHVFLFLLLSLVYL